MCEARKIIIRGKVQGVGFRPFLYALAIQLKLKGTVQNNLDGVKLIVEGTSEVLHLLCHRIKTENPRLSRIDFFESEEIPFRGYDEFTIIQSEDNGASTILIPSDAALCEECRQEMLDENNFRYQYPFINCTQCGPRYTIIRSLPYDRPATSMDKFPMCEACTEEYNDISNRRHHAQPIACKECGPRLLFYNEKLEVVEKGTLIETIRSLKDGKIVAIKGLGGFHLACDANNEVALQTLRSRKKRGRKPFAIMVKDMESVKQICHISLEEEQALKSVEAPIVLLKRKNNVFPNLLAPGMTTIGVMLPFTPLHTLLFETSGLSYLVMTSANISGCPIISKDDDESLSQLLQFADSILTHNRDILHSIDDSVIQIVGGECQMIRRGRGYAPDSFFTKEYNECILAVGGQQKNTFTLSKEKQVFVGPHIGDCESIETISHWRQEVEHMCYWLKINPMYKAVDKHPNYEISKLSLGDNTIPIQHHHAHMASVMIEHDLTENCFGIILDGTGYGDDGSIWGFEILEGNKTFYERRAHLRYTPLLGGEKSVKSPKHNAIGMLLELFPKEKSYTYIKRLFSISEKEITLYEKMIEKKLNTPYAGTCGRLLDSISAILGICLENSYDGEAAVGLSEMIHNRNDYNPYPFHIVQNKGLLEIDFTMMIEAIIKEKDRGIEYTQSIVRVHSTIIEAIITVIKEINKEKRTVVYSGGCFCNPYLHRMLKVKLKEQGYVAYYNKQVPCNDGGLSLGQMAVAAAMIKEKGKVGCV